MASISVDKHNLTRIQFIDENGKRRTIRLGRVSRKVAQGFKLKVEAILSAKKSGQVLDEQTARWISGLGESTSQLLSNSGLTNRVAAGGLGSFLRSYIDRRSDIKPRTRINLEKALLELVKYFGPDRELRSINEGLAEEWTLHLKEQFAENTARRLVGRAKQFFKRAVQLRIITSNPFDHLKSSVIAVKERQFFISRENVQKVLDACPNSQWRLLFALSRFGGLRCPSEHLLLKWSDVDWSAGKIRITSPKTEHHIGKGERWIPLFPELRSHLETAFEEADEGAEFVIHRYRNSNANLRTQLLRIIQRAGISPWPKLFQNLRSTRETELAEQYPLHVVTAWLGNSQPIALKHYLQVTDAHFQRAAGQSAEAAQNPAQYLPASGRMTLQPQQKNPQFSEENEGMRDCTTYKVPKRGVEPPRVLPH